jgi:AcrR family transcriptional regulator
VAGYLGAMSGSPAAAATQTETPVRRRGAALTKAIFAATLEELAGSSFSELTFEKIALRAGAGRMSLYRRWSDPAALLRDALADEVSPVPDPNTGSLREDLLTLFEEFARELERPYGRALQVLLTQRPRHPELSDEFRRVTVAPRTEAVLRVLRRAEVRGEVTAELITPRTAGVGLLLVVMSHLDGAWDPAEIAAIVDEVVLPLIGCRNRP